ncbi:TPA: N-formylglutamate amidohydrolase [Burkholderia vietnamiensis]|nr:N-formylglutamate amidohydrolase [Burkholderia vietnamiensis]
MHDEAYGHIYRGDAPILVATPHIGTSIPEELMSQPAWVSVQGRLADPAGAMLRAIAGARGVSCIAAGIHPCVIDFNVPADNRVLSSGLGRASLCRTHTARGESLYGDSTGPSDTDVAQRVERYWAPYHDALATELQRLRGIHGNVLLLVSHALSWLSPYQQQPDAADCNVGTSRGASCDRRLVTALTGVVRERGRSWVVNGRVADSFAAQHYGMPAAGIHAMEVEFAGGVRQHCGGEHADRAVTGDLFGAMLDALVATLSTLPKVDSVGAEPAFKPYA